MTLFLGSIIAISVISRRRTDFPPLVIAVIAGFALIQHPFGDMFTGSIPSVLYPIGGFPIDARISILGDPTLNLMFAMIVELSAIWASLIAYSYVSKKDMLKRIHPATDTGLFYGVSAFVISPPTIDSPHIFVYSVTLLSFLLGILNVRESYFSFVLNGVFAFTVSSFSYILFYLLLL